MRALYELSDPLWKLWQPAFALWGVPLPEVAPTRKTAVYREGPTTLWRATEGAGDGPAVVLVPSLIGRWYAYDLCEGHSLFAALQEAGYDVFVADWGVPHASDRSLRWEDLLARLSRCVGAALQASGQRSAHLVGYSLGGTMALCQALLEPERARSLTLLCAPVDFSRAGLLRDLMMQRRFPLEATVAAGNVSPWQVLAGIAAAQPAQLAKQTLSAQLALWSRPLTAQGRRERRWRLAAARWLGDGVPFPAGIFRDVVERHYRRNELWEGSHAPRGRALRLEELLPPALLVTAGEDAVAPPECTLALAERVPCEVLRLEGSHLTGVLGMEAEHALHAPLNRWLSARS